jgi:hypothetical protein
MEVDAGAVLEQAGGTGATSPAHYRNQGPAVVLWDGPAGSPLTNVSLVGVGTSSGGVKSLASPVAAGWSIANSFTFDLDPQATSANNLVSGLMAMNVNGFLVANVFSIQNDYLPPSLPSSNAGWWPSSRKAALGLRAQSDSPVDHSAFYDPQNGTVTNWYNIDSPPGYGPNQVDSAQNVTLSQIYSQGGTALRLETDNSNQEAFGSELNGITASDIEGVDCNRAVSFSPHFQTNYNVNVSGVSALDCYQGIIEADQKSIPASKRGAFLDSTVSGVTVVGGPGAEVPAGNGGLWTVGTSYQAFARAKANSWAVTYTAGSFACNGAFKRPSDAIVTGAGTVRPTCGT